MPNRSSVAKTASDIFGETAGLDFSHTLPKTQGGFGQLHDQVMIDN